MSETNNTSDDSGFDTQQHQDPTRSEGAPTRLKSMYPRRGGLRLRSSDNQVRALHKVIRAALDAQTPVTRIEVLSMPGESQQEWILVPHGRSTRTEVDDFGSTEQEDLTEWGRKPSAARERKDPKTGALISAFEQCEVSEHLGYDICDVDFSPIEGTVRPTCRLTVRSNPDLLPSTYRSPHAVKKLISDLNEQDIPYVFQTIVSNGGGSDYELSQRLALFPPDSGIATESDFADLINAGGPGQYLSDEDGESLGDLSEYFLPEVPTVTSNFNLDPNRYFDVTGTGLNATVERKDDRGKVKAERARRLIQGKTEYQKLLAGLHETDPDLLGLYPHRDYYTKLPVDTDCLEGFFRYVPWNFTHSPWGRIQYADQPTLIARSTAPPPQPQESTASSSSTLSTQGSEKHRDFEEEVAKYYLSRGYTVSRPDTENSESVPDLIIENGDETFFAEVEYKNKSKPANILTNAARADYYDTPVIFFAESKSDCLSIMDSLRQPVKQTTETGAWLYTKSEALTLDDGRKPVLPPDADGEAEWYVVNDDPTEPPRVELRADGRVIASGDYAGSVKEWEFDTDHFASDDDVPDHRTRIHPPFRPTKLTYLSNSTFRYKLQDDEFVTLSSNEYQANWNVPDEVGKRKRYSGAFEEFLDDKTVSLDGAELLRDDVIEACLEEYYQPQTDRKAPGTGTAGEAGRALWKHAKKKETNPEDAPGKVAKVANRTWAWPRGVVSPDLPFVGSEPAIEKYLEPTASKTEAIDQ